MKNTEMIGVGVLLAVVTAGVILWKQTAHANPGGSKFVKGDILGIDGYPDITLTILGVDTTAKTYTYAGGTYPNNEAQQYTESWATFEANVQWVKIGHVDIP